MSSFIVCRGGFALMYVSEADGFVGVTWSDFAYVIGLMCLGLVRVAIVLS